MNPASIFAKYGALAPAYSPANDDRAAAEGVESCGTTGAPVVPGEAFSGNESPAPGLAGCIGNPTGPTPSLEGMIHWRDFPAVVALSEFLRSKPMDISLARDPQWRIILRARPGVTPEEPERWEFYRQALALVEAALPDLYELMDHGGMTLPMAAPYGYE